MKCFPFGLRLCSVLVLAMTSLATADEAADEAIKRDRKQIAGTWRVVGLEINGNKANEDDTQKLTVINRLDGTWSLHSEGKEVSAGTSELDPSKTPKTIDFKTTEGGGKGNQYHGIYQLDDRTRKMCFAPAGKERPGEFASTTGSDIILVVFERVPRK